MSKEYFIKKPETSGEWWEADAKDCLAKTVHEDFELIDIGVLDSSGNKIMARKKANPIGFVHFPDEKQKGK